MTSVTIVRWWGVLSVIIVFKPIIQYECSWNDPNTMLTIPGAWVCIGLHLKSCKKLTSELGARTLFALTTEDCVHMENTYPLRGNIFTQKCFFSISSAVLQCCSQIYKWTINNCVCIGLHGKSSRTLHSEFGAGTLTTLRTAYTWKILTS